jgi:flagellin
MIGSITLSSIAQLALDNYELALSRYGTANLQYTTGYRVNSAADDPTGAVRISTLQTQISSITQAIANSNDVGGLLDTATGALSEMGNSLDDILALAEAATGTLTAEQRAEYQAQVEAAVASMGHTVSITKYGSTALLDGSYTNQTAQIGPNAGDSTTISINDMSTATLGSDVSPGGLGDIDLSSAESAATAVAIIESAIGSVSLEHATLTGIKTYVIDSNVTRLTANRESLTDALESIRDISTAEATANLVAAEAGLNAASVMVAHSGLLMQNVMTALMGTSSASTSTVSSLLSMLA